MVRKTAPFKRGQKLVYTDVDGHTTLVRYVRWWGRTMADLVDVETLVGRHHIGAIHVESLTPVE